MRLRIKRNGFLVFGFIALTSVANSMLIACFRTTSQNPTPNITLTATATSPLQHMNHAMELGPADSSYDLRFIDGMILHHQGALNMAQEVRKKSHRGELKTLAQEIITSQSQEIARMHNWRSSWYPNVGDQPMAYHSEMGHMMPMTPEQQQAIMMSMDLGVADEDFDLRFINAMIPHHEGAVIMAQDALRKSQRPEIKKLAQEIIKAQDAEIQQMKQWRENWYNKS